MKVRAQFVKSSLCECGFPILREDVPLGTEYLVETDSVSDGKLICGGCKKTIAVKVIHASGGLTYTEGIMPLEIFELDEGRAA